jgi:hypothetical protein
MAIVALNTKVTRDSMASDIRERTGLLLEKQLKDTVLFDLINDVIDWYRGLGISAVDQHYETEVPGIAYAQASGQGANEFFLDLTSVYAVDPLKIRIRDEYGEIHVKPPSVFNNRIELISVAPSSSKWLRLAKITQFNSLRQCAVVYIGSAYSTAAEATVNYPRMPQRPAAGATGLDIPDQAINPVRDLCIRQIFMDILRQPVPGDVQAALKRSFDDTIAKHNLNLSAREVA